jgi:hypothetical protein
MHSVKAVSIPAHVQALLLNFDEEIIGWIVKSLDEMESAPASLKDVEAGAEALCQKISGLLVEAVLACEEVKDSVRREADKIIAGLPGRWRMVTTRSVEVVFLCGAKLRLECRYLTPRFVKGKRAKQRCGFYPELAVLGVFAGASPGLQSEAARLVVLLPSFEHAARELACRGAELNCKTVRRIALNVGEHAMGVQHEEMERWRQGDLAPGEQLAGKRVVVSVDGGKARTRRKKRGSKGRKNHPRFHTPWREPRLVIIYVIDETGRLDKDSFCFVDGVLDNGAGVMEVLAYHLHRLGAAKAQQIEFVSDGAAWIWNRVKAAFAKAAVPKDKCRFLVDPWHALKYVSEALGLCSTLSAKERDKLFRRLRRKFVAGKAKEVIETLRGLCKDNSHAKLIEKKIAYLVKHLPNTDYGAARAQGFPIGSGFVESAVRRVINLRLKSPGMFWNPENLKRLLYMRARLMCGQWEPMMQQARAHAALQSCQTNICPGARPPDNALLLPDSTTFEEKVA